MRWSNYSPIEEKWDTGNFRGRLIIRHITFQKNSNAVSCSLLTVNRYLLSIPKSLPIKSSRHYPLSKFSSSALEIPHLSSLIFHLSSSLNIHSSTLAIYHCTKLLRRYLSSSHRRQSLLWSISWPKLQPLLLEIHKQCHKSIVPIF